MIDLEDLAAGEQAWIARVLSDAKKMLKEKGHAPAAIFVESPDGVGLMLLDKFADMNDHDDKERLAEAVRIVMRERGVTMYAFLSDTNTWKIVGDALKSCADPKNPTYKETRAFGQKREALCIFAEGPDWHRSITQYYKRTRQGIVFEEAAVYRERLDGRFANLLAPEGTTS
jgi:hypothetical protein